MAEILLAPVNTLVLLDPVASGRLDASIALSNHPWDMAGGTAIAREAGALVLDADATPHSIMSSATVAVAPALRDSVAHLLAEAK